MTAHPVSETELRLVERFLYDEAALLDQRDFESWLALLDEDITYLVTTQVARRTEDGVTRLAVVDDRGEKLRLRVAQLADPNLTHAENPSSLTRRFISNIRASRSGDSYEVTSNLLVHVSRANGAPAELIAGLREDRLRKQGDSLCIANRSVHLDQTVLHAGTLSILL